MPLALKRHNSANTGFLTKLSTVLKSSDSGLFWNVLVCPKVGRFGPKMA